MRRLCSWDIGTTGTIVGEEISEEMSVMNWLEIINGSRIET